MTAQGRDLSREGVAAVASSTVLGVDAGPERSGWVLYDPGARKVLDHGEISNWQLVLNFAGRSSSRTEADRLALEGFSPYGARLGRESLETIKALGWFEAAWMLAGRGPVVTIERPTIKQALCDSRTANDAAVRDALIHRFGPGRERAIGGVACRRCKGKGTYKRLTCESCNGARWLHPPGRLHGIRSHRWAALAVAVVAGEVPT